MYDAENFEFKFSRLRGHLNANVHEKTQTKVLITHSFSLYLIVSPTELLESVQFLNQFVLIDAWSQLWQLFFENTLNQQSVYRV